MSRSLGINKDLEPLARRVRRAGGHVEITRSNHVRWSMPSCRVIRTGLTMSGSTARVKQRAIESELKGWESRQPARTAHSL